MLLLLPKTEDPPRGLIQKLGRSSRLVSTPGATLTMLVSPLPMLGMTAAYRALICWLAPGGAATGPGPSSPPTPPLPRLQAIEKVDGMQLAGQVVIVQAFIPRTERIEHNKVGGEG